MHMRVPGGARERRRRREGRGGCGCGVGELRQGGIGWRGLGMLFAFDSIFFLWCGLGRD